MSHHPRHPPLAYARRGVFRAALLCLALTAVGAGCAPGGKKAANAPATAGANANGPATDRYKVTADTTAFYLYSPQEPGGADETLKKGTEVTLEGHSFGYSRVKAPDGQVGYVGTGDITQLSAEDLAAENAAQQQLAQAAAQQRLGPAGGGYTIPPEAGSDERLPLAEPTPKPTPPLPFHY